jgi:hypothetical protein
MLQMYAFLSELSSILLPDLADGFGGDFEGVEGVGGLVNFGLLRGLAD